MVCQRQGMRSMRVRSDLQETYGTQNCEHIRSRSQGEQTRPKPPPNKSPKTYERWRGKSRCSMGSIIRDTLRYCNWRNFTYSIPNGQNSHCEQHECCLPSRTSGQCSDIVRHAQFANKIYYAILLPPPPPGCPFSLVIGPSSCI